MPSIVYVAGARPNFMKVAPLLEAARGGPFERVLVHTGQHYDYTMSGVFFEQLGIPQPDVHLEVGSGTHGVQTGRIMVAFEEYILGSPQRPSGIVVVGDVNSTMACALVGAKLRIPVAHVEAGLRSFDREMPEELNRIVTDAMSDVLFATEPAAIENLRREGVAQERIELAGNVMIDTVVRQLSAARALQMERQFGVEKGGYAVATFHRPSNVDEPARLSALCSFLQRLANATPVVFAVHPRTEACLRAAGLYDALLVHPQMKLSGPLGYREFLGLMDGARLVVTDSGGVQEETSYLGVPCVTMRANTERPITVTNGTNVLVGDDIERAWQAAAQALAGERGALPQIGGWDGHAAERIVRSLSTRWRR